MSTATRSTDANEASEAKRKLEELFGGKSAAPATSTTSPSRRTSSGKVFASPRKSTGRSPSDYRMRLERLRMAREPEQIRASADHFLEHHQLPDEVDILIKVLQHPSEKVLREAMGQLSALLMQGRLTGMMMLDDRLKELARTVKEDATISYIEGLRSQIDASDKK